MAQRLKFGSQVTARVKAMGVRVCNPGAGGGSGGWPQRGRLSELLVEDF